MFTNYLSSGTKNKQNTQAKIDIANARIVTRAQGSFVGIFGRTDDDSVFDMQGCSDLLPTPTEAPSFKMPDVPDGASDNELL